MTDERLKTLTVGQQIGWQQYTRLTKPVLILTLTMANTRPFVGAALLCEKAIREGDGVVSLIRVVDTYYLHVPKPVEGMTPVIELTLYMNLKSGDVTGNHTLKVVLRQANGKQVHARDIPVALKGGIHGLSFVAQMQIASPGLGLSWFDLYWNDEKEVLTSVPFNLLEAKQSGTETPSATEPEAPS